MKKIVLALILILMMLPLANAQAQLSKAGTFVNVYYALSPDNGYLFNNKLLFFAYPDSNNAGKINLIIFNSTYDTIQKTALSTSVSTGFNSKTPYIKFFGYNTTHVLMSIAYAMWVVDSGNYQDRLHVYVYPYFINTNTLQITALPSANTYVFRFDTYYTGGYLLVHEIIQDFKLNKIYVFIASKQQISYQYNYYFGVGLAYYDLSTNTMTALTNINNYFDTGSTTDTSKPYITAFALAVNPNWNYMALIEMRNPQNGLFYRWVYNEQTNIWSKAQISTSSASILDVNTLGVDNALYPQNYPDTVQLSGSMVSFYMFDSYLQAYQKISLDLSSVTNTPNKQTIINIQLGSNLYSAGQTQFYAFYLKTLSWYYYDGANYNLRIVTYNSSTTTLYSDNTYTVSPYAGFVLRLSNTGFFIGKGSNANTLDLFGNMVTTPTLTITQTQTGGGGIYTSAPTITYSAPNILDVTSLALGVIAFLMPIGIIYEYTKNSRISIIFGLVLGTIFGSLLGIIPIWLTILIGIALGIYLFTNMSRGE